MYPRKRVMADTETASHLKKILPVAMFQECEERGENDVRGEFKYDTFEIL
jgi:hypothetical protein